MQRRLPPRPASVCGLSIALVALAALWATDARSAPAEVIQPDQLKRMSVDELLQQDVLSVSRRSEPWAAAPSNVFLITSRAPGATGARSLPELLRLAPNLFVAQSSSYHWGIEARGFMRTNGYSNKLLLLIDGRTAYSPLFSNVFWESTDVFLPDLDRAEVISGPSGANWGANAVNGVINVTSKSALSTLGSLTQVSAGSEGTQFGFRHGFALGANGAARVFVKRVDRDPTLAADGTSDDHDAWHTTLAGFRADWGDQRVGALTIQGDGIIGRYEARPLPRVRSDTGNLLLRYSRLRDNGDAFWIRAYYDYALRDESETLSQTTRTLDAEFQDERKLTDTHSLLWGANVRRITDKARDTEGFVLLPGELRYSLISAFAQHEWDFARERFRLISGLRLEHNEFTGWEVQPTIRLAWHDRRQTAWIAASRATRVPSRLETGFYAPEEPPYTIAGGPGFRSETLDAFEVGWRGQPMTGLALTATLFLHDYDHLRTVEAGPPVIQANGRSGRSYGSELFLDYDVAARWRFRAGGFLVSQENWLHAGSVDLEQAAGETSFPHYQLFLRNTFQPTEATDLWLSLRFVDAVPASEDGGGEVPAYSELDASWRWRFRPGYEFSVTGRNLLDRSHPEIGGLLQRREIARTFYASVRIEY